jgi:uncharacterized protein YkwD
VPAHRARLSGRARYLLCGLLVLPLLAAAGLYLTRGTGPAPASATGKATAGPRAPAPCDPSAAAPAGSCAGQPFHAAVASVPASLSPRPSAARAKHRQPRSSPTASASARPASPASATAAANPPAGTSAGSAAAQVLALINQARSAAGLPALTITAGLNASASKHNSTMAGGCGLSHQCPGESDLGARETAAGVHWTAAGENIGEGGPVTGSTAIARMAVSLTQSMLNEKPPDDGHRKNILSSSFTHIGIAVFRDSSGTVWLTQDFSN